MELHEFSQFKISVKHHSPVKLLSFLDCCSTEVYVQRFDLWLSFKKNDLLEVQFIAKCFRGLWEKRFVVPLSGRGICICFRQGCCDVDSKAIKTA